MEGRGAKLSLIFRGGVTPPHPPGCPDLDTTTHFITPPHCKLLDFDTHQLSKPHFLNLYAVDHSVFPVPFWVVFAP